MGGGNPPTTPARPAPPVIGGVKLDFATQCQESELDPTKHRRGRPPSHPARPTPPGIGGVKPDFVAQSQESGLDPTKHRRGSPPAALD